VIPASPARYLLCSILPSSLPYISTLTLFLPWIYPPISQLIRSSPSHYSPFLVHSAGHTTLQFRITLHPRRLTASALLGALAFLTRSARSEGGLTIINNNFNPPKIHPPSKYFRNNKYPNLPTPKLLNSFIPPSRSDFPMYQSYPYPFHLEVG
jgi:hypothetical protein